MCDVTHPQCHAITLAITTTITRNTSPPMTPPITTPTFCSSEESFSFLLGALEDDSLVVVVKMLTGVFEGGLIEWVEGDDWV